MSGIKDYRDEEKLAGLGLRIKPAEKSDSRTRRVHRKNKKGKKRRQLNEVNLQDLEREGLLTKHLPGRHDQSSHGNRIGAQWGASHGGSSNITAAAARALGNEEGFSFTDEMWGDSGDNRRTRLAARSALRGVRDSAGVRETLYSGHVVAAGSRDHKVGEELTIPAMATSGGKDTAEGYSSLRERQIDDGDKESVLFEFEPGTKAKGYQKNENYDRNDPDWNYKWDEAIVSGRFEVVGVREEEGERFHYGQQQMVKWPRKVYTLRQTAVFDPDSGEWVSLVDKQWHFDPRQPRDRRGRWTDGFGGGISAPNERRQHRDDVSPFPSGQGPSTRRRATGARSATPAKKSVPAPRKTAAKKTASPRRNVDDSAQNTTRRTDVNHSSVQAPRATKSAAAPRRVNNSMYDHSSGTVASRSSIPRINRGGTHIQQHADGRPIVTRPYNDPGEAYYQRNAGPNRISNERLQEIFEDPSKMTLAEKRMIASAGGAKALDGTDPILVNTSRGPRELERYALIGQLRSKIAPGSGNSKSGITRGGLSEERRKKMAEKRRESGKPNAAEFGKIEKQITEDWSTDGGKTVVCVFCGKKMSPHSMSVETPKPKSLGGNYKDRGGRWPAHATCNTKAGEAAQKDPVAYQEEMMKKFNKLPKEVKERLPHVYDYFPQLGKYPGTAAQRKKYMARGPK